MRLDGLRFDDASRVDLLIEGSVVIELKSVETLAKHPFVLGQSLGHAPLQSSLSLYGIL